jgi:hypothetical protein
MDKSCSDCIAEKICLRRNANISEGMMRACGRNPMMAKRWDGRFGVTDESVVPSVVPGDAAWVPSPTSAIIPFMGDVRLFNGKGPGSQLLRIYESKGVSPCQQCYDLASKMNSWGIDGCKAHLEEIVIDILPRAREWIKRGWVTSFAPDMVLKVKIRHDARAAIRKAEEEQQKEGN